jgi:hypothetical protein
VSHFSRPPQIRVAEKPGKVVAFTPQVQEVKPDANDKKRVLPLLFFLFSLSAFAQEEDKPFHTNPSLPDTLCFSAKITTYRKSVTECFYEVKITCKSCAEENFKNFYFYKHTLFKTIDEALETVKKAETDCRLFKPTR